MHFSKSRALIWAAAVFIAASVVAACGSNIIATPTPTRTSAGAAASPVGAPLTGLAAQGQQLFVKYQCTTCHSLTGERIVGPPLNGLYGSSVTLTNGKTVVANDAYLKTAILEPDAQIVNGYPSGVMSSHIQQFESQIATGDNLNALVAYLTSLK